MADLKANCVPRSCVSDHLTSELASASVIVAMVTTAGHMPGRHARHWSAGGFFSACPEALPGPAFRRAVVAAWVPESHPPGALVVRVVLPAGLIAWYTCTALVLAFRPNWTRYGPFPFGIDLESLDRTSRIAFWFLSPVVVGWKFAGRPLLAGLALCGRPLARAAGRGCKLSGMTKAADHPSERNRPIHGFLAQLRDAVALPAG
jgi:hypothetical protein